MPITPAFSIAEANDGSKLTLTETTGDAAGGYDGTPDFSDVTNTRFEWELPDGSLINLSPGYLPTQNASPNGTQDFLPADIGLNTFGSGVYTITMKIYTSAITQGGGNIVAGVEYIVTGNYTITYNGVNYAQNEVFIGISAENDFTIVSGSGSVNSLEGSDVCDAVIYRKAQKCIQGLLLTRCNKCDCGDGLYDAAMELLADFNGALVAFNVGNNKCSNDTLLRIDRNCANICNDCEGCN
jgi:hypothetical protein